jgi:hypothetical protein
MINHNLVGARAARFSSRVDWKIDENRAHKKIRNAMTTTTDCLAIAGDQTVTCDVCCKKFHTSTTQCYICCPPFESLDSRIIACAECVKSIRWDTTSETLLLIDGESPKPITATTSTATQEKPTETRDLKYYAECDKVFWVVNETVNEFLPANAVVPCIYVEVWTGHADDDDEEEQMKILQFDVAIAMDSYRYTAWRKFLGEMYEIRVDVLLISDNKLFKLDGKEIDFATLSRSNIIVDKEHLARFALKMKSL